MRKLRSKANPNKIDLSPWPSSKDAEPSIEEHFSELYLHHSIDFFLQSHPKKPAKVVSRSPSKVKAKPKKSKATCQKMNQQKRSQSPIEIKTLAVIKDYCKKFYTQAPSDLLAGKENNINRSNMNYLCLTTIDNSKNEPHQAWLSSLYPVKKPHIVDLTRTFQDQFQSLKNLARPKSAAGSKILKIKQEIRRHKQEGSIQNSTNVRVSDFYPGSKSLPLRMSIASASRSKKGGFPSGNFSKMLSHLLTH